MTDSQLPITSIKGYQFNTLYWQDDERVPVELRDEFNSEMAKLGHLQIHAAMMEDSKAIQTLALQQNMVYSIARNIAYCIKNG